MKNVYFLFVFILLSCAQNRQQHQEVDRLEAQQVILDYFEAIVNKNYDEVKNLSTADYVLYEDGAVWNNDSLILLIQSMPLASIEYEFRDFNVESDCNGAFINYLNHGILTLNDSTKVDYNWIESAYVKRVGDELKIDFIHSTVAK